MISAGFRTVFERCHLYPKSKTRGGTCPKGGDVFPFLAEDIPIPIPAANIPRVVAWRWNIRFYSVMPIAFWSYPVHLLIFIFCGCFTFCQLKLLFLLVNFLVLASKISNFGPEIDMVWPNFHRIDEIHFGTWVPSGNQTWQWNIHHIQLVFPLTLPFALEFVHCHVWSPKGQPWFLLGGIPHPQILCLQAPSSVTASLALAGTAVAALSAGSRKVNPAMGYHPFLDLGLIFVGFTTLERE